MLSGGIERDQWHEMDQAAFTNGFERKTLQKTNYFLFKFNLTRSIIGQRDLQQANAESALLVEKI